MRASKNSNKLPVSGKNERTRTEQTTQISSGLDAARSCLARKAENGLYREALPSCETFHPAVRFLPERNPHPDFFPVAMPESGRASQKETGKNITGPDDRLQTVTPASG